MKNNISIYETLDDLAVIMTKLTIAFEGNNSEGINLNETEAINSYPFGESFDELTLKVIDWVYTTREEIKRK